LPKGVSRALTSIQRSLGKKASRATVVCSGNAVAIKPHRSEYVNAAGALATTFAGDLSALAAA